MKGPRRRIHLLGKNGDPLQAERNKKRFSVGVAVPQRGQSPSSFTNALVAMMTYSSLALQDVADIMYSAVAGTYIHTNRNDLTGTLLKEAKADFILWLDDDMTFPRDTLVRLLLHKVAVVGANYPTRKMPITPVAIKTIGAGFGEEIAERLHTREGDTGLERVEAIGFGVCLVRADVLWDVGYPWFETRRDEKLGVNVGEDVDFCMKARAAGHDVFVDHGLSHEVRHIGQMEYSVAHAVAFEEEAHGDNDIRRVTDGGEQLAEPQRRDDAGHYPRLHSVSGSEAESDGGDSG